MFLTIESARLPCCTTFSRLPSQHVRQLGDVGARLIVDGTAASSLLQLVEQLGRERGEIVDEVERVLDLMGDAGGELAERGELFRLD